MKTPFSICFILGFSFISIAQLIPPNHISFPPTITPPNTITSYTRASQSIKLQCNSNSGFQYGLNGQSSNGFLNLSVSPYPPFVNSAYLGSAINPNSTNCSNYQLNFSGKPVAETKGEFNVNNAGAANYQIPIFISPGTNGMQPKLSISYSSHNGLGLLGNGWQLNGISSISRTNKLPYLDGTFLGITLTNQDVFAIDGNRMFPLSGNYGSPNASYYCELENFADIISYGIVGSGPEKFLVKDKEGNTIQYGFTSDSQLKGIGNSSILNWLQNQITDEFGNFIKYAYKQLNGETVIDNIEYTGNANAMLSPYNKVTFNYIPIAESNSKFLNGAEFKTTQLLKEIICWANNKQFKKYVFEYEWREGTYLSLVKEVDASGNELIPIKFCYDNPNEFTGTKTNTQTIHANLAANDYIDLTTAPADFNADGFSDFACFNPSVGRLRIFENTFITNYGSVNNQINFTNKFDNPNQVGTNELVVSSNVCDENGDGKQEIFSILSPVSNFSGSTPNSNQYYILKINYDNNNNVQVQNLGHYFTTSNFNPTKSPSQFMFNVQDFTGDGLNDILKIDNEKITLISNNATYNYTISNNQNSFIRPISFDSDGAFEYIVTSHNGNTLNFDILKFIGNSLSMIPNGNLQIQFPNNSTQQKNLLKHITFGDINGDGYDDIIYVNEFNSEMYVRLGTGNSYSNAKQITSFTPLSSTGDFDISCVDVNADGKMDIIINESIPGNSTSNYYSYLSFGDVILKGGSYQGSWKIGNATRVFYEKKGKGRNQKTIESTESIEVNMGLNIQYADFNGDGIFDYTNFNNGSDHIITNNVNGESKQLLKTIYTPMGNNIEIRYANIGSRYSVGNNVKEEVLKPITNPGYNGNLNKSITNMYCVSHVFFTSGFSGQFKTCKRYLYSNPTFHRFGKGFLGFEKIHAIDLTTNIGSEITHSINPSYYVPIQYKEITSKYNLIQLTGTGGATSYSPDLSKPISKVSNTIQLIPTNPASYFFAMLNTEETDYLNSNRVTNLFTYNLNTKGQIQSKTKICGWDINSPIQTSVINYTYTLNNGSFKINKINTQATQSGQSPYSRDIEYIYDNQGHMITKLNDNNTVGLSNHVVTTAYSNFNLFGNPTQISITAPDVSNRNTIIEYDPSGRFITKQTNAIGNFCSFKYEPFYGNLIESQTINGLLTKYEYDPLGRLFKTIYPNNTSKKITYQWESPTNYPYSSQALGAFSIKAEEDESPYNKVYYTGNGLILRNETQDYMGTIIVKDNEFNESNQSIPPALLLSSTEPHYLNQAKFLINTFEYEPNFFRLNMIKTFSVNSGTSIFTGYYTKTNFNAPCNFTTYSIPYIENENQLGQKTKQIFNSAGQLFKLINSNFSQQQNATYQYDSNGQLSAISLSNSASQNQSIQHTFSYNGLGQKVSMYDPSHGTTNFEYNSLGELLKKINQSGVYTYTYDQLGRILTKVGSQSGTYSYQYISSGNGKEHLWKIIGPTNITEYEYNQFNQLTQSKETEIQNNKVFMSKFTYNNKGREIEHSYPSGYKIKNQYNTLGFLVGINDQNNQPIWRLRNMDALNRITEFDYGNGIVNKHKYNDLNQLEEIQHGSLHKQLYAYDQNSGNLSMRRFQNFIDNTDLQEVFSYDDNDRLGQSALYDPNSNSYSNIINTNFDPLGNISHKADVGDYHYTNSTNPFLLTQLSNVSSNNINLNTLSLSHTDFNKAKQISEMGSNKVVDFVYGNDEERLRVNYYDGSNQYVRYYGDNYDRQESSNSLKEWTYIYAPSGLCAVYINNNGTKKLNYVITDHLGSPVLLTSTVGTNPQALIERFSFDAWGRKRNPYDWSYTNVPNSSNLIRSYTMHEQIEEFSLINMNGRIYDALIGRFIQPDNYIQAPDNLQNFNRYSYCLNNPLKYNDPSGNIIAFTDSQYEYWKSNSKVAIKINYEFGSDVRKAGIEVSLGIPKISGLYGRVNIGANYYWRDVDNCYTGWEGVYGAEIGGMIPLHFGNSKTAVLDLNIAVNHFDREGSEFDQTTSKITIGGAIVKFQYENDFMFGLPADNGDGLRTAAAKLSVGEFAIGFNLFTGDPGGVRSVFGLPVNRTTGEKISVNDYNGQRTYIDNGAGGDPDKYRAGIAYVQYGNVKIGRNSEKIRHAIQNRAAHDVLFSIVSGGKKVPHFKQLNRPATWYFSIGSGNASSLW